MLITPEELVKKLRFGESNEIAFKTAYLEVPTKILRTVSAFANTNGGLIVFGVTEIDGKQTITGVKDVDRVQSEFLNLARNPDKISLNLPISAQALHLDDGHVLCFRIPEASVQEKPVFLNKELSASYIRKGANNFRCDREELLDFIRNASSEQPYDSQPIATNVHSFYDEESLTWYRKEFEDRVSKNDDKIDSLSFLRKHGFVVELEGRQVPTRAAVLLFGDQQHILQHLPKMVVDLQWYSHSKEEYSPIEGWGDREILEVNLIKSWQKINNFFSKHSLRPYELDPKTLKRIDDPPENDSYREAAINLLVHQDYGNFGRRATIRIYKDIVEFNNPGNAFLPRKELLVGGEKRTRNPQIVNAFRRIGLSEQAGSGLGKIFTIWRLLGYVPPSIENDKPEQTFRLRFPKQKLIGDEQSEAMKVTGANLDDKQRMVFAYLHRFGEANTADLMALTGLFSSGAIQIADSLVKMDLAKRESTVDPKFVLSKIAVLADLPEKKITGQNDKKSPTYETISKLQHNILGVLDKPKSLTQIMKQLGYFDRKSFRTTHLKLLIDIGAVKMTNPHKPNSPSQKYSLTEYGWRLWNEKA